VIRKSEANIVRERTSSNLRVACDGESIAGYDCALHEWEKRDEKRSDRGEHLRRWSSKFIRGSGYEEYKTR
jgi:seryl-tRNA(Sec) selenium transferase